MAYYLITSIFGHLKALFYRFNSVASISVSCYILIYTLNSDLQSSAPITEHISDVVLHAKVGSGLYSNTNALSLALFWVPNSLLVVIADISRKTVVQISNKIVSILFIQRHKSSSHDDKLHFLHWVAQLSQLVDSVSDLNVWVVSSSYGSHRSWLISSVGLSGILEIWVWSSWTVNTNVTSGGYVGTSVGLAHDCNHCYSRGRSDGLGL